RSLGREWDAIAWNQRGKQKAEKRQDKDEHDQKPQRGLDERSPAAKLIGFGRKRGRGDAIVAPPAHRFLRDDTGHGNHADPRSEKRRFTEHRRPRTRPPPI